MAVERVACIERSRVNARGLWAPSGELEDWSDHVAFIPRHKRDPKGIEAYYGLGQGWIQLVAYVVPRCPGGVFVCRRKGGSDPRLEGRYSIGIGGHINLGDWVASEEPGGPRLRGAATEAAAREIYEEAPVLLTSAHGRVASLIYVPETRNPVERVHLGLVVPARVPGPIPIVLDDASIEPVGWRDPAVAVAEFGGRLEAWSEVILNSICGGSSII